MLVYAREPDSEFTAVHPDETGLPMTLYASEIGTHPALIVDGRPGVSYQPSIGSIAYRIGEMTGNHAVDQWVVANVAVLRAYCAGQIDSFEFHNRMRPIVCHALV
jgi:hypothetical protein